MASIARTPNHPRLDPYAAARLPNFNWNQPCEDDHIGRGVINQHKIRGVAGDARTEFKRQRLHAIHLRLRIVTSSYAKCPGDKKLRWLAKDNVSEILNRHLSREDV